jgi:hypothetical protein
VKEAGELSKEKGEEGDTSHLFDAHAESSARPWEKWDVSLVSHNDKLNPVCGE